MKCPRRFGERLRMEVGGWGEQERNRVEDDHILGGKQHKI